MHCVHMHSGVCTCLHVWMSICFLYVYTYRKHIEKVCMDIYIFLSIYVSVFDSVCLCIYIYMWVYIWVHIWMVMCTCLHVCISIYSITCTYVYMYAYIRTCMDNFVQNCLYFTGMRMLHNVCILGFKSVSVTWSIRSALILFCLLNIFMLSRPTFPGRYWLVSG